MNLATLMQKALDGEIACGARNRPPSGKTLPFDLVISLKEVDDVIDPDDLEHANAYREGNNLVVPITETVLSSMENAGPDTAEGVT